MRPKPTREWVMAELERLGVRVVSGRLGRKAGEEDEPEEKKSSGKERQHSRLSYVEASLTVVILFGGLLNEILIPNDFHNESLSESYGSSSCCQCGSYLVFFCIRTG